MWKVNSKNIFFSQNKLNNLAVYNLLYSWTIRGTFEKLFNAAEISAQMI